MSSLIVFMDGSLYEYRSLYCFVINLTDRMMFYAGNIKFDSQTW